MPLACRIPNTRGWAVSFTAPVQEQRAALLQGGEHEEHEQQGRAEISSCRCTPSALCTQHAPNNTASLLHQLFFFSFSPQPHILINKFPPSSGSSCTASPRTASFFFFFYFHLLFVRHKKKKSLVKLSKQMMLCTKY